jgi:hypothetical protein
LPWIAPEGSFTTMFKYITGSSSFVMVNASLLFQM